MQRTNIFTTMGANGLVHDREENDFYATEPKATELLLEKEVFNQNILEPCAGMGHIRDVLVSHGYNVTATNLIYRGVDDIKQEDVFNIKEFSGDIITNPPYKIALPILKHCLDIIPTGNKVAMFLKILFLEGKERKKFFEENPPKVIYVASGRLNCAKNGGFDKVMKTQPFPVVHYFVDKSKFTCSEYTEHGWKVIGETMPSYVYYKGSECIDKQCEQNLMQLLGDKFNSNETPEQNLVRNGYLQVYDCGSIEVIYRKEAINDNKEK